MENKHLDPIRRLIENIEPAFFPNYEGIAKLLKEAKASLQLLEYPHSKEQYAEYQNSGGAFSFEEWLNDGRYDPSWTPQPDALESKEFNDFLTILEDAHFKMMECSSFDEDYVRYCEEYGEAVQSFKQFIRNNFKTK